MSNGAIVQWDQPYKLYHEPVNRFVADFIGNGVFVPGESVSKTTIKTSLGLLSRSKEFRWPTGTNLDVLLCRVVYGG